MRSPFNSHSSRTESTFLSIDYGFEFRSNSIPSCSTYSPRCLRLDFLNCIETAQVLGKRFNEAINYRRCTLVHSRALHKGNAIVTFLILAVNKGLTPYLCSRSCFSWSFLVIRPIVARAPITFIIWLHGIDILHLFSWVFCLFSFSSR